MTRVLLGTLVVSLLALTSLVAFSSFNAVDPPIPTASADSDCPFSVTEASACSATCCDALKTVAAQQAPCCAEATAAAPKPTPCCAEGATVAPKPTDK
jgi:hypothetical protein